MSVGTSDLSSYSISSSGRPLMPPFWLTYSICSLMPFSNDAPGAAPLPVRLLERPILIGSPVAGPAAVVSVLGAAVVSVGAAVVSVLGAAVVSVLGAAVVVVSVRAAAGHRRERDDQQHRREDLPAM